MAHSGLVRPGRPVADGLAPGVCRLFPPDLPRLRSPHRPAGRRSAEASGSPARPPHRALQGDGPPARGVGPGLHLGPPPVPAAFLGRPVHTRGIRGIDRRGGGARRVNAVRFSSPGIRCPCRFLGGGDSGGRHPRAAVRHPQSVFDRRAGGDCPGCRRPRAGGRGRRRRPSAVRTPPLRAAGAMGYRRHSAGSAGGGGFAHTGCRCRQRTLDSLPQPGGRLTTRRHIDRDGYGSGGPYIDRRL